MTIKRSKPFYSKRVYFIGLSVLFLSIFFVNYAAAYDESFPVDMTEMVQAFNEGGKKISGGVDMTLISRYVWRGQYYTQGPGWQPEGFVSGYGFTGSVWGSMALGNEQYQGKFSEIDLSLIYAKEIYGLTIAPGYVHYFYPVGGAASTGELFLMLDYKFKYLHIFTSQFFDVKEYRKSYYGAFGVAFLYDFKERFSLKTAASTSWGDPRFNEAYFTVDKWTSTVVSLDVSLGIEVLKWLFIKPGATYDIVVDGDLRKATGEPNLITVGVDVGFAF
ncbi:MAG: hypothetical protein HN337_05435 [Deltaproteobacteria bacterium]|nr:hypothetical protein [Deltaproteobacteria bacterium]